MITGLALVLALGLAACGQTGGSAGSSDPVGMVNPWREIAPGEAAELCPAPVSVPKDAGNVVWSAMDAPAGTLVQLDFDLDGVHLTARQQATGKAADVSGMYYGWTTEEDSTLTDRTDGEVPCHVCRYIGKDEYADLCTWYDAGTGASWSLSAVEKDLDGFDITAIAQSIYAPQGGPFAYVHDPRENPEAMKDIVENADAVYGFSPDPQSQRLGTYAEYDWTDPELVAKAQEERRAYHESLESMTDILYRMRDEGATVEEMARAVSAERNRLRLAAYENDPKGLEEVKASNRKTYGHEDGPTADEMFEKYGSWQTVLQKAFSANLGMDACCGLYDEYYQLYIELGYAEE